jgi:hypothetical protein
MESVLRDTYIFESSVQILYLIKVIETNKKGRIVFQGNCRPASLPQPEVSA